jgi:hypothetical protein
MISGIRITTVLALAGMTACDTSDGPADANLLESPGQPRVVFLTLNEAPNAVMEALLDAPIVRDEAGCLRHATEDYTLIWPVGYTLVREPNALVVRDADGVGRIGERFTLGGGVLLFLHDGLTMTAEARALAASECPGQYWLVGTPVRQ